METLTPEEIKKLQQEHAEYKRLNDSNIAALDEKNSKLKEYESKETDRTNKTKVRKFYNANEGKDEGFNSFYKAHKDDVLKEDFDGEKFVKENSLFFKAKDVDTKPPAGQLVVKTKTDINDEFHGNTLYRKRKTN